MSQEIRTLSREQVQQICPLGADKMKLARIKSLSFTDDGLPADDSTVKLFSVLRQDAKDSLVSSALSANYVIKHEGSEWVLYDHSGDKVLGKHKTEAEALAQERAIQVSKNHAVSGLKNMDRVEVFKKCPECAGKMAATSQDMPVDAGGHMQHICGKGGRAVATAYTLSEDQLTEYERVYSEVNHGAWWKVENYVYPVFIKEDRV